jgi:Xaa-Pro aminopeptidase
MKKSFSLSNQTIKSNIKKLKNIMADRNLDAMYISSFDPFLNEYVPLEDNHRFYFTAFTGSMAEVLVPAQGKVRLYVDGRYHEQADLEVDLDEVEVVKCGGDGSTTGDLLKDITEFKVKRLGYEADRTSLGYLKRLTQVAQETVALPAGELAKSIEFEKLAELKEVTLIPQRCISRP